MVDLGAGAGTGVGTGRTTSEGVGALVSFGSSVLRAIFEVEVEVGVVMGVEEEDGDGDGDEDGEAEGLGVGLVMMMGLEEGTLSLDALRLPKDSEDGETGGRRAEGSKRGSVG